ncbi:CDC27 protein [Exophiala xenobiotica]|uniref:DNA polymerase delta subunit 3 n=1 Tax=Vermiconidia calcicola TaxID=1690605 RepID=A0AAV9Q2S6_9PEZI|nr:CDC27 protein [Exophiala xenobiotica]KAK5531660.1 CDC27 protein [Chaetothyriales sp. CCFEE 6169]KAK5532420.1 CDC27 protein [Vermiconidia calcicola]KAK5295565.1 CDC27 protein [Exophiala xenobiotica]KAK5333793.1 CDC27 protein [Exophiala xenobiotica]
MSNDFKKYLAAQILSEQHTVSYRNVSRALRAHVNAAKCMLYEFYEFQNGKKPGSVYATYLLSGLKKQLAPVTKADTNGHKHDLYEDEPIPSSPPPFTSSMLEPSQQSSHGAEDQTPQVTVRTVTLVREENLEEMREQYETITSIHIYSLSPARIQDLVALTDIGRGLFTDVFAKEDPLEYNKIYGIIQNPQVRRRKGKRPVIPQGPAPKFQAVKEESKPSRTSTGAATQSKPAAEAKSEEASRPSSRDSTTTNGPGKQPALKRGGSDLFRAFAKQGQQKPKSALKKQDSDTPMKDDEDEGESEDEALFLDTGKRTSKKRPSDAKKEREDKAAKLRKMMDSDDEAEPEVPAVEKATDVKGEAVNAQAGTDAVEEQENEEDGEGIAWSDSDTEKQRQTAPKKDASTKQNDEQISTSTSTSEPEPKRRRGKRKVMKKRTTKDEDGYLVTKEEAVWESYSEDEPEPTPAPAKKELQPPKSSFGANKSQSQQSASQKGGGKAAPKKGGNIMSFFGKKDN